MSKMIDELLAAFKRSVTDVTHRGVSVLDGAPIGSGRYPLGSGENPIQRPHDFYQRVQNLRNEKISFTDPETGKIYSGDAAIARSLGMKSTGELRAALSIASEEIRSEQVSRAKHYRYDLGYSLQATAKEMGFANDSSVRSLLKEDSERRMNQAKVAADYLKERVDTLAKDDPKNHGMIDVGTGVERQLNLSKEKLNEALYRLKFEGYETYGGGVPQVTNHGKQTNLKILCSPGTEHKEIYEFERVHPAQQEDKILTDGGDKIRKAFEYPASLDSKRLTVKYAEDGGIDRDGLIEIRRGVKDLSLKSDVTGNDSHYAQVRILVDGTHYLKGMAVYSDDLPDGVDVRFNTNKAKGTPVMGEKDHTVLKRIKDDPKNPFGSLIKEVGGQSHYIDDDGKEKLSLINKRGDEGDWDEWQNKLPSQFLGKQSMKLIRNQLNLSIAQKEAEFDEIKNLTNPTVKKKLLETFSDDCDAASVKLKAASLPGQRYQVILPLKDIKDNEVYAPNFKHGQQVALVRFPHQGTFEIPICTVNNKNREGQKVITNNAKDAVGINKTVADRLSGADFDGDTVMVIPLSDKVQITSTPQLKGLVGFDPKIAYGGKEDGTYKRMTKHQTQIEMGKSTNLITDMTLKGASPEEITKATKHALVVIDAEKHGLDWQQSEKDNDILELKKRYQGTYDEKGKLHTGASTLLTRAKSEENVVKRQGQPKIDPETGRLIYKETDNPTYEKTYTLKNGETRTKTMTKTQKSTKMAEAEDARELLSGNNHEGVPKEILYANYANKLKSLANEARLEYLATGKIEKNQTAAKIYEKEVQHLDTQLDAALRNAPRERQAHTIANSIVKAKKESNPDMTPKEVKKAEQQALTEARIRVGAKRTLVEINDKEWEAIQNGAISETKLKQILNHADSDRLRELATPRASKALPQSKIALIKAYAKAGHTNAEIAEALCISPSTVSNVINPK